MKTTHLFHIGFIVFVLDSILPLMLDRDSAPDDGLGIDPDKSSLLQKLTSNDQGENPIRVLVIGDSLAIGVGCIEEFDPAKDNSIPMALIENTAVSQHARQGPVFPRELARSLSYHFKRPVQWRSAGVDGGDVNDIQSFCMDTLKQENADAPIDIVVVLFGVNDLKSKLFSVNPIHHFFPKEGGCTLSDMELRC